MNQNLNPNSQTPKENKGIYLLLLAPILCCGFPLIAVIGVAVASLSALSLGILAGIVVLLISMAVVFIYKLKFKNNNNCALNCSDKDGLESHNLAENSKG